MTKQHMLLYKKWRNADMLAAILGSIGLIISLIEYEIGFNYYFDQRDQLDTFRNILRLIVSFLSISCFIIIIIRYFYKIKWKNLPIPKQTQNLIYNNDYTNLMRESREKGMISFKFFLDILILTVHPLPFWDKTVIISEYLKGFPMSLEAPYLLSDFIIGTFPSFPSHPYSLHVSPSIHPSQKSLQPQ